ncbi:MAG: cbb3-type cytochrome oxidase assembly protein CcoS [Phycisphaerales bacterium]|nr:cbb3-type cytochrome oxidase assembly protein CcoS [Phycisphaerales bacterium]
MSVILIMIPGAMILAGLGVWAFIIAAKKGQFDDLDTPAIRAVFDDDDERPGWHDPSHTIQDEAAPQDQSPPSAH